MTKYRKMSILHHISAYSHTCGFDAITFIGSTSSLEVTLTLCYDLSSSGFPFQKSGGGLYKISAPNCKKICFDHIGVLTNSKFFQFQRLFIAV